MAHNQTNPSDNLIERKRSERVFVAIISPLIAMGLCYMVSTWVLSHLLDFPMWLGAAVGFSTGTWFAIKLIEKSIIINKSVQAFVTIDPLQSLLGKESSLVCYGPGTHISFWWEQRIAENNINLSAVAIDVGGTVQTTDGIITKRGGVRLRPDIRKLEAFLSGVGSVPDEISGLIEAEIIVWFHDKTVKAAIGEIANLNKHLQDKFVGTDAEVEKKYGILIDDVTISELLPSKEIQETLSAITENRVIDAMVAESFGYKSVKSLHTARRQGKISEEAITRRRTEIMASSGNLQGMTLSRADYNLNLTGLDNINPDVVKAIAGAASAYAQTNQTKGGKK